MRDAGIEPDVVAYTTGIKVQNVPLKMSSVRSFLVHVAYTACTINLEGGHFSTVFKLLGPRHL